MVDMNFCGLKSVQCKVYNGATVIGGESWVFLKHMVYCDTSFTNPITHFFMAPTIWPRDILEPKESLC